MYKKQKYPTVLILTKKSVLLVNLPNIVFIDCTYKIISDTYLLNSNMEYLLCIYDGVYKIIKDKITSILVEVYP